MPIEGQLQEGYRKEIWDVKRQPALGRLSVAKTPKASERGELVTIEQSEIARSPEATVQLF